jgi:hypothetical protein
MRLMGHKTRHIFQRYNVVVADDLVNATKAQSRGSKHNPRESSDPRVQRRT